MITAKERKDQILNAGAKLAAKNGARNVTRKMVAETIGVSAALVSAHMGGGEAAQKAYARQAKKLGLMLPDAAATAAIGKKLRAHGPRDARDTRKRSAKEVDAIKRKKSPARAIKSPGRARPSPASPTPSPSAARAPKAPPATASAVDTAS